MSAPLCFIGIEADGVHPGRKPWEVALIRREPDGSQEIQHLFVQIDLSTADRFGLDVGRFYARHPLGQTIARGSAARVRIEPGADYLSPAELAPIVARMTHRARLVGAVPNFDAEVFDRLLRGHGLCPSWRRLRCVETLTAGHLRREVGGLAQCATALGIEIDLTQQHAALARARTAKAIYDAVMTNAVPTREAA